MTECRKIRPAERYAGKQGFTYDAGIARESVGATGLCMHLLTIPLAAAPEPTNTRRTRPRSTSCPAVR